MKYLLILLLSFPVFAGKIRDHVRTFEKEGTEFSMTLKNHAEVFRFPASEDSIPCLENAFKARKPVDLVVNDKDKEILDCKLAPSIHPGARQE